uniref:Hexosyltransferase n=2 Tax=Xenopus tropicalis TaxID=8364 RepID=F7BV87_XENTR
MPLYHRKGSGHPASLTPKTMVRCRKFFVSITAILTLVGLKIYFEIMYELPIFSELPPTPTEPPRNPLVILEPFKGQEDVSMNTLHDMANNLRRLLISSNSYWNNKEQNLLDSKDMRAWTCKTSKEPLKDLKTYPEPLQLFLQHGGCREYRLIIDQPDKCPYNRTFLLLAIKSSPQNFAQRQAVRSSWGTERCYGGLYVRLVFLLGVAPGQDFSPLIWYENGQSHDLLQWDFLDTFFNLTLKDQLFLGWARLRCSGAKYILKGDDDVFVRTPEIVQELTLLGGHQTQSLYMGHVVSSAKPYRDPRSKYYIPYSYYAGSYPPYAGGGGYVFSGALTPWLYLVSYFVIPFPIDDVYTGMCFMALGMKPTGHPGFQTFEIPGRQKYPCCSKTHLLLEHKKSPQEMLQMWSKLRDHVQHC